MYCCASSHLAGSLLVHQVGGLGVKTRRGVFAICECLGACMHQVLSLMVLQLPVLLHVL